MAERPIGDVLVLVAVDNENRLAAIEKALAKKRPKEGWPPPEKKRASPKRAARNAKERR